jgi:hypothetical protein
MHEQVAAVNANGRDMSNPPAGELENSGSQDRAERPAAKFLYPGGSRPLEGYTIKRGVGHGGFGEIYYAVSDAGKEVALKLIRRNLEVELRGIRQCLNLKHPNLVALYDIRQDDQGDTWVVMEFVSGGCLADALAAYPNGMPVDQALTWFRGTAAGVAYLHDRGIVHRDLKPGNIFCEEGLVKVGDYGLSKFISCSRRSGQTESVGTVHYMAPEVANGRYGKEIDVYALGIILYEMLTGRVPFEGESVGEVLMKHLTAKPDVSMLPEPYRSAVARALEKDPARRFGTVGEMLAALPAPSETPLGGDRLPVGTYGVAAVGARRLPETQVIPKAHVVDEEPVLKAVREAWFKARTAWTQANLATPLKVIILLAVVFALVINAKILVPLAILLAVVYVAYRVVRMMVISGHPRPEQAAGAGGFARPGSQPPPGTAPKEWSAPSPAPHDPQAGTPPPGRTRPGHRFRPLRREEAAVAMVVKSPQERLTELVGSLLAGALVAVAMCVVMVLLNSLWVHNTSQAAEYQQYAQYGWLVLVSIAATWAVLIPSKFWEGSRGEATLRRFIMMVIGLVLGLLAFGAAEMLSVNLSMGPDYGIQSMSPHDKWPANFYDAYGRPREMAFLACFGTLFLLLRWWRQADPLRSSRLSLWSMFVSVVGAVLVAAFWGFQQASWLVMVAGAMSASVQLASPWVNPRERAHRKKA